MRWLLSILLAITLIVSPVVLPAAVKHSSISPQYVSTVLEHAKMFVGTRYRWGGDLRWSKRTDCSGFVQFIYRSFGIELPRTARAQAEYGETVTYHRDYEVMAPADLIFFRYRGRIRHVAIYLGNYKILHSSSRCGGVVISDLRDYRLPIAVVKRLI
jgi:cell wall-associated NlpC family hydrolase